MARYRRGAFGERILIPDSPARGGGPKPARSFTGTVMPSPRMPGGKTSPPRKPVL